MLSLNAQYPTLSEMLSGNLVNRPKHHKGLYMHEERIRHGMSI